MKTPICEQLGIEFPIFAFSHCRDVVAAVSKAGGLGVLGAVVHGIGVPYFAVLFADATNAMDDPAGATALAEAVLDQYPLDAYEVSDRFCVGI